MENFNKFIAISLAMIISPIIRGFVFSKLWLWFIVPTFQMQPLKFVEAIGIILLINFFIVKLEDINENNFWEVFGQNAIFVVVTACFALFSGWILTLFL